MKEKRLNRVPQSAYSIFYKYRVPKMIGVGSAAVKRGEKGKGYLKVGELAAHVEIKTPVLIVNGIKDGPTLWLNGAAYGDELNDFLAIRRIAEALEVVKLQGALIGTPLCNPLVVQ
jgi:predicted deacylase